MIFKGNKEQKYIPYVPSKIEKKKNSLLKELHPTYQTKQNYILHFEKNYTLPYASKHITKSSTLFRVLFYYLLIPFSFLRDPEERSMCLYGRVVRENNFLWRNPATLAINNSSGHFFFFFLHSLGYWDFYFLILVLWSIILYPVVYWMVTNLIIF